MTTTRIYIPSPQTLTDETEAELSLTVNVTYEPGVPLDQQADAASVEIIEAASHRCELSLGELRLNLPLSEQDRLFQSWLRREANLPILKAACAQHWNTEGREAFERECRQERSEHRASLRTGPVYFGPDVAV